MIRGANGPKHGISREFLKVKTPKFWRLTKITKNMRFGLQMPQNMITRPGIAQNCPNVPELPHFSLVPKQPEFNLLGANSLLEYKNRG